MREYIHDVRHRDPETEAEVNELFRFIRMPFLPLPLAVWTLLWPSLLSVIAVVVIPSRFLGTTIFNAVRFPFVFLGAAYANEPGRVTTFFAEWRAMNDRTFAMTKEIKVNRGYGRLIGWWSDPKSVPNTGWIIATGNIFAVILIGMALSEMVRTAVGIILVAIVGLVVLGLVT